LKKCLQSPGYAAEAYLIIKHDKYDKYVPSDSKFKPVVVESSNKLSSKLSMAVNVREKLSCLTNNVFTPMVIRRKRLKNRASVGLCLSPVQFFQMFMDDAAKLG